MDGDVQGYLEGRFEKLRLLKKSSRGEVWLAADTAGMLVIWKEILYTGLPYRQLKDKGHGLWPEIICLVEDGTRTIVIEEYVSGHTLQQLLTEKEYLGEKAVAAIAMQLCDGLAVLHGAGIIHRDIKPANLIWGNGVVRLIDFDASREVKQSAQEDTTHLGTKGYAPPEQFGYGQTDARSDIYALGVTLLELLGPDYHGYLRRILEKCREVDPKKRYQNVQLLQAAIQHHQRNRLFRWSGLLLAVLLLFVSGYCLWQKQQGNDSLPVLDKVEQQMEKGLEKVNQQFKKGLETLQGKEKEKNEEGGAQSPAANDTAHKEDVPQASPKVRPAFSGENAVCTFFLRGTSWNGLGTVCVSPEEWSGWQWKLADCSGGASLPNDWVLRIHIDNQSNTVLENPRVRVNYEHKDRVFSGRSLSPGEAEDIAISLSSYTIYDWNEFYIYIMMDSAQKLKKDFFVLTLYLSDYGKYREAHFYNQKEPKK